MTLAIRKANTSFYFIERWIDLKNGPKIEANGVWVRVGFGYAHPLRNTPSWTCLIDRYGGWSCRSRWLWDGDWCVTRSPVNTGPRYIANDVSYPGPTDNTQDHEGFSLGWWYGSGLHDISFARFL